MTVYSVLFQVFVLHWIALLSPGANVVLVTHLAGTTGRRLAFFAALGISMATFVWSSSALLGLAVVVLRFPLVGVSIQILGVMYLAYIGLKIFRSRANGARPQLSVTTTAQAFGLGFSTNILNPKSAVFFASIFVSILPSGFSAVVGLSALAVVMLNVLAWHFFLAYFFSTHLVRKIYLTHLKAVNIISGVALILIACVLLISSLFKLLAY